MIHAEKEVFQGNFFSQLFAKWLAKTFFISVDNLVDMISIAVNDQFFDYTCEIFGMPKFC